MVGIVKSWRKSPRCDKHKFNSRLGSIGLLGNSGSTAGDRLGVELLLLLRLLAVELHSDELSQFPALASSVTTERIKEDVEVH